MKKFYLLFVFILCCSCLNAQVKKTNVRRTSTSAVAKQKAEAEEKARAEAKAKAEAEAVDREIRNDKCYFSFDTGEFISMQGTDDYVVYEIPNMSASELKSAIYTTLSSMYNSPKDVITNLSDNMIQVEGYKEDVYSFKAGSYYYFNDISFNMVIQFKDGKVRYNRPTIKMLYIGGPLGKGRANMSLGIPTLINDKADRRMVNDIFSDLIRTLNNKLKKSNDW